MNFKIFLSLMTLVLVLLMSSGAVVAYFSDSQIISNNSFSTGTVKLDASFNTPLSFDNLLPGVSQYRDISVKYNGTLDADLYFGLSNSNLQNSPFFNGGKNESFLEFSVFDRNINQTVVDWQDYGYFLTNWSKIANKIKPESVRYLRIYARLKSTVDNSLQGQNDSINIVFHATQSGSGVDQSGDPAMITSL